MGPGLHSPHKGDQNHCQEKDLPFLKPGKVTLVSSDLDPRWQLGPGPKPTFVQQRGVYKPV